MRHEDVVCASGPSRRIGPSTLVSCGRRQRAQFAALSLMVRRLPELRASRLGLCTRSARRVTRTLRQRACASDAACVVEPAPEWIKANRRWIVRARARPRARCQRLAAAAKSPPSAATCDWRANFCASSSFFAVPSPLPSH